MPCRWRKQVGLQYETTRQYESCSQRIISGSQRISQNENPGPLIFRQAVRIQLDVRARGLQLLREGGILLRGALRAEQPLRRVRAVDQAVVCLGRLQ